MVDDTVEVVDVSYAEHLNEVCICNLLGNIKIIQRKLNCVLDLNVLVVRVFKPLELQNQNRRWAENRKLLLHRFNLLATTAVDRI